jgi:hypothetical protein
MAQSDNVDRYAINEDSNEESLRRPSAAGHQQVPDDAANKVEEGTDTSIGSGSADQGIDLEDLNEESEFGNPIDESVKDVPPYANHDGSNGDQREKFGLQAVTPKGQEVINTGNVTRKREKGHGLVQEGPGPDS